MTSLREWRGHHNWLIRADSPTRTPDIAGDAARLAANCDVTLQMSASNPGQPPRFEPHLIQFNSREEPNGDFQYPPDVAAAQAAGEAGVMGQCRTNLNDYDALVRAIMLSIKHHLGDDALIMPHGIPEHDEWKQAIDLYCRTFPERKIPALVGWPKDIREPLDESAEHARIMRDEAIIGGPGCPICAVVKHGQKAARPSHRSNCQTTTGRSS